MFEPEQFIPICVSRLEPTSVLKDSLSYPTGGALTRSKALPTRIQDLEVSVFNESCPETRRPAEQRISLNRGPGARECVVTVNKNYQLIGRPTPLRRPAVTKNNQIHYEKSRNLGHLPVQILNLSEEKIILSKGHRLMYVEPLVKKNCVRSIKKINSEISETRPE